MATIAIVLLHAGAAGARPSITVADFVDSTGTSGRADRVRAAIVKALQEADAVDVIPYPTIKSLAASRRVKASDLAKPKLMGKVVQAAGGGAAVTATIARSGAEVRLALRIHDVQGAELWAKTVALAGGELKADTAQRFAAAIAASVGVVVEKAKPPGLQPQPSSGPAQAAGPEPEPEPERTAALAPRPAAATQPVPGSAEAQDSDADGPSRQVEAREPFERKPGGTRQPDPDESVSGPLSPAGEEAEEDLARPGWVHLTAEATFTWRSYRFCPEVTDCSQPVPSGAGISPVSYSMGAPYSGVLIRADVFPLRFLDNFVRGVGLSFGYGSSFGLKTRDSATDLAFGSREERISAELLYRLYFRLGSLGEGWAGLRGGWLRHAFYVDSNSKILESLRSGFYGQLDLGLPLYRFLRIEAKGTLVPFAGPGDVERQKYGAGDPANNRPTQGGGWMVEAGLTTDFGNPGWHVGLEAMFEYLSFADRYNNPPTVHPEFGRAIESYLGLRIGLRVQM